MQYGICKYRSMYLDAITKKSIDDSCDQIFHDNFMDSTDIRPIYRDNKFSNLY